MTLPEILEGKRDGRANSAEELATLVHGAVDGSVPDYQIAAWLMAVYFRGMSSRETADFTRLMMTSGEVLDLADVPGVKVDKHSTGGVGDKISIPLAPLVASAGVTVPMISGRGLGHTGGTLDKLESIPGLTTSLDPSAFRRVLREVGFVIAGAGMSLAPADARLYALRDVTGTVPSIPLIVASILSKKFAAGVDALVLDVKCGAGAFMRREEDARALARALVDVSAGLGKRATALMTSMYEPLGRAVGNALEVRESLEVLRGRGPIDVVELTLALGAQMTVLAGVAADVSSGRSLLVRKLGDGSALETFARWIARQGGDAKVVEDDARLPRAALVQEIPSTADGWIASIDAREVGLAANALGAGRMRLGDPVDPAVGFVLHATRGDAVRRGQPIAEVHARSQNTAREAQERFARAVAYSTDAPAPRPHILETIETAEPGVPPPRHTSTRCGER
jgi:pyrimidine-nucleoside phosphorylase